MLYTKKDISLVEIVLKNRITLCNKIELFFVPGMLLFFLDALDQINTPPFIVSLHQSIFF